jgi:hypothetical protein
MNILLYEVEVPNAGTGPETFYFGTDAMITSASDTPPLTTFRALVSAPGGLSLKVFGSNRSAGLVQRTWGEVSFFNTEGDFDDWRNFDVNGGKVTCRYGPKGGAYPGDFTTVFIAYVDGVPTVNDESMTLDLRGREVLFGKPVNTVGFDGSGGIEGSGVAGKALRRKVLGRPGFIGLTLIDEVENVWHVMSNPPADLADLENGSDPPLYTPHDGGIPLLANGLFASEGDLFTEPVDPAQYMHWAGSGGDGEVYVKLGSFIATELRYSPHGAFLEGSTLRDWTVDDLANLAGVSEAVPSTDSISAGNRVIDEETFEEVFNDIAAFEVASLGFNQLDEFVTGLILPTSGGTDFAYVQGQNSRRWESGPIAGMERRVWQLTVHAGRTQKSALAATIADGSHPEFVAATRDQLVRDQWLTNFVATSEDVLAADSSAGTFTIEIDGNEFATEADMLAFANRWMALHSSKQVGITIEVDLTADNLARRLLDTGTLTSERGVMRNAAIIEIEQRLADRKIGLTFWSHTDVPADVAIARSDEDVGAGGNGAGSGVTGSGTNEPTVVHESFVIACSDETTALTTGTAVRTFFMPYDFEVSEVQAALVVEQTSGSTFTVDINDDASTILSTKLTIDNTESTSITAATPPVLSSTLILKGSRVTIDIDQVGDGTACGLVVTLIGVRA